MFCFFINKKSKITNRVEPCTELADNDQPKFDLLLVLTKQKKVKFRSYDR